MHVSIRQIGNSLGILIPKPMRVQAGLDVSTGVDLTLEGTSIMLRRPALAPRVGWAESARAIAEAGDDALVLSLSPNEQRQEASW